MIQFDRFLEGKRHILTMSYDDGNQADRRLIEIFNKYGIRGTFHLNSGTLSRPDIVRKKEIPKLYKNHEVAVHTVTHPHLERIPLINAFQEVLNDRHNIEILCGYVVRGMSYPYGTYNDDVVDLLKQCGIVYSRTTNSTKNFSLPADFLRWNPTCHHKDNLLETGKRFLDDLKFPRRSGLLYVWGHSYEFDRDNNWEMIEAFCKQMSGCDEIWYATNIEIVNYLAAQKNLRISVDNKVICNPSAQPVWVSSNNETIMIPGGATVQLK
jgi:peptidoglycan-N-acetylglucosamine deacetylase